MVARTAFTQLRRSALLLLLCTASMVLLFLVPPAAALAGTGWTRALGGLAWTAMAASYLPVLRYYGRSPAAAALLPLTGALYLGMTWHSALRHWRGRGAQWKGRAYGAGER